MNVKLMIAVCARTASDFTYSLVTTVDGSVYRYSDGTYVNAPVFNMLQVPEFYKWDYAEDGLTDGMYLVQLLNGHFTFGLRTGGEWYKQSSTGVLRSNVLRFFPVCDLVEDKEWKASL